MNWIGFSERDTQLQTVDRVARDLSDGLILIDNQGTIQFINPSASRLIRRALEQAGLSHIPVISFNANGMEKNEGFRLTLPLLSRCMEALVLGDILMRCLYRTRPYEAVPGSAEAMKDRWMQNCSRHLAAESGAMGFRELCGKIVEDFDALPLDETLVKPRVGIVGEILVKYMPLANNHLVELLEEEGAEAVVPDLLDFFTMCLHSNEYRHAYMGGSLTSDLVGRLGIEALELLRKPAVEALARSRRFAAPRRIERIAEPAKPFLSLGNQYGEGWFLCGEMIELLDEGAGHRHRDRFFGLHQLGGGALPDVQEHRQRAEGDRQDLSGQPDRNVL